MNKNEILHEILNLLHYKPIFKNKVLNINIAFITGNRFVVVYTLSYGQQGDAFKYEQIDMNKLFKLLKEYAKI